MRERLLDIATLRTGIFAKPSSEGELVYLQVKHFDESGNLQQKLFLDLPSKWIGEQHLLKPGDVLFAAKGVKNFAAVYEQRNEPAVASTSFLVLRLNTTQVLPEYLAWFLNSDAILMQLKAQAIGTSIPSISKQVLEAMAVPIPELNIQNTVIQVSKLRKKEAALKESIEALREKQLQYIIHKAINK